MKQYLELLQNVIENGQFRDDRTGTGTYSVFGAQQRFDLRDGFPCLTTKKLHLRSIIHELLWFLNGDTNIKYLNENVRAVGINLTHGDLQKLDRLFGAGTTAGPRYPEELMNQLGI